MQQPRLVSNEPTQPAKSIGPMYRRAAKGAFLFGFILIVAPASCWVTAPQLHDSVMSTIIDGVFLGAIALWGLSRVLEGVRLWGLGAQADRERLGLSVEQQQPGHTPVWLAIRAIWLWGYLVYAVVDVGGFLLAGANACSDNTCTSYPLWDVNPPGAPGITWIGIFLAGLIVRLMFAVGIIALGLGVLGWIERRVPLGRRRTVDLMAALQASLDAAKRPKSQREGRTE